MQPQPNADLFKTNGEVKKRVRDKFTSSGPEKYVPDEPVVAAKTTEAVAEPMKNEHIKGLGIFTTTTRLEVKQDLAQFTEEFSMLGRDLNNDLCRIATKAKKTGRVSLYARRQLQDKLRRLNAANERLSIMVSLIEAAEKAAKAKKK